MIYVQRFMNFWFSTKFVPFFAWDIIDRKIFRFVLMIEAAVSDLLSNRDFR